MKTKATCYFFVLFAIIAGMGSTTPATFADHGEVTITTGPGNLAIPGCEETDECYTPSVATIDVGGKVIMTNTDSSKQIHSYTSGLVDGFSPQPDNKFDSGLLMENQSFEWSPDAVGEYPYYCITHVWMQGTIIVQEVEAEKEDHGDDRKKDDMVKDDMKKDDMVKDDMKKDDMVKDEDHKDMTDGDMRMSNVGERPAATGMLSDSTMVSVWATTPTVGEMLQVELEFKDSEHVNYDVKVMQNGVEVLNDENAHQHNGKGTHTTAQLKSSDPVDITVTFQGYGVDDPKTGPIGDEVVFLRIIPEFGTIAMMILAVAIISVVAVTAKSRIVPRF